MLDTDVYFISLYSKIILQCTVQKHKIMQ